jgi:hypothetical protein
MSHAFIPTREEIGTNPYAGREAAQRLRALFYPAKPVRIGPNPKLSKAAVIEEINAMIEADPIVQVKPVLPPPQIIHNGELYGLVKAKENDLRPDRLTISHCVKYAAHIYGVSEIDIRSDRKTAIVVRPRHFAMWLARTYTTSSFPIIGYHIGHRDHTACLFGWKKICRLIFEGQITPPSIEDLRAFIFKDSIE